MNRETTDLDQWHHAVNLRLWACLEPPLLECEVALYWETGLSPELTVERILSASERPRDGDCSP